MNEVELKPCPFCGRAARMVVDPTPGFYPAIYHAECASCGAAPAGTWENPAFAAEAWNRRADPWRSVEKDPPPDDGVYLFWIDDDEYNPWVLQWKVEFSVRGPDGYPVDPLPTWWMPIPPLPKEVEG